MIFIWQKMMALLSMLLGVGVAFLADRAAATRSPDHKRTVGRCRPVSPFIRQSRQWNPHSAVDGTSNREVAPLCPRLPGAPNCRPPPEAAGNRP
jgi:hypothetical protein